MIEKKFGEFICDSCGKTTPVQFVVYGPHGFQINSIDLCRECSNKFAEDVINSLRDKIGIVQQDVFLFGGTIKANILYGRPSASEEEVIEAAKRANILDFINSLPNGWDTEIGERGVRLSGGQKQRIAIARALLKHPKVLIFDDATSALDLKTESLLYKALRSEMKDTSIIIIAQRVASAKDAKTIMVLEDGKVVGMGSSAELLANNPVYQDIYYSQLKRDGGANHE